MPSLFSIDPQWAGQNQGGQGLDFSSNIASPTQDMATANSPGYGAPPVSQPQSQGMGFMDWVGKIGDIMQSTGAGLQGRPDPVMARRNQESEMQMRQQQMKQQQEAAKLHQAQLGIALLDHAQKLREKDLTPEQQDAYAQQLSKFTIDAGLSPVHPNSWKQMLASPDLISKFKDNFPELTDHTPPEMQKQIALKLAKGQDVTSEIDRINKAKNERLSKTGLGILVDGLRNLQSRNIDLSTSSEETIRAYVPPEMMDAIDANPAAQKRFTQILGGFGITPNAAKEKGMEAAAASEAGTLKSKNTLAMEKFGKPFDRTTEGERRVLSMMTNLGQDVKGLDETVDWSNPANQTREFIQKKKDEALNKTQARTVNTITLAESGKLAAKAGGPISPDKMSNYVDITGKTPQGDSQFQSAKDVTPDNLRKSGYRYLPEERLRGFHSSQIALQQVDRLEKMGEQLYKNVGKGENLANALKLKGNAILGDAGVRAFEALIMETLPTNALASGLTPGRVGEAIIEHIEKPIMPNMTDTYDSFKSKIRNMKQRFKNNMDVHFGLGISPHLIEGAAEAQAGQGGAPSSTAPAVGKVQKGYRFKGGDPSKQENWEKVQ